MQKSPSCSRGTFRRGLSLVYSAVLVSPVRGPIALVLYDKPSSCMAQCGRIVRLVPTPHSVRSGASPMSPLLHGWTQIQFVGPAILGLMMREPVGVGNRTRFGQAVDGNLLGINPCCRLHALMDCFAVHAGVNPKMHNMNILWSQLARHRLRHGAEAELCRRKRGKPFAAPDAGRGACEKDGAVSSFQHVTGGLAADQKPCIARQFPRLEEQLFGGFQQRLADIRSGVEETDLDRSNGFLDAGKQALNVGFLAG